MSDAEHPYTAALRFAVREVLQRNPNATYQEVEVAWRANRGDVDAAQLRAVYEQETGRTPGSTAAAGQPQASDSVLPVAALWVLVHVGLWLVLGLPGYLQCLAALADSNCGRVLATTAIGVGGIQLLYGLPIGSLLALSRTSGGQGILLGTALVALFNTLLCFAGSGA